MNSSGNITVNLPMLIERARFNNWTAEKLVQSFDNMELWVAEKLLDGTFDMDVNGNLIA